MKELMPMDNCQTQNEFIEKAIRFYAGYLMGNAASDFLPQALVSAIRGTLQDSENRTSRLLFKLAVEVDMMMHLFATAMEIERRFWKNFAASASGRSRNTNRQHLSQRCGGVPERRGPIS